MTRGKSRGHKVWGETGRQITDATGTYSAHEEQRKSDPSQKRWRLFLGPQNLNTLFTAEELFDLEDLIGKVGDYIEDEEEKAS